MGAESDRGWDLGSGMITENLMDFVLEMMDFVLEMMGFVLGR